MAIGVGAPQPTKDGKQISVTTVTPTVDPRITPRIPPRVPDLSPGSGGSNTGDRDRSNVPPGYRNLPEDEARDRLNQDQDGGTRESPKRPSSKRKPPKATTGPNYTYWIAGIALIVIGYLIYQ